MTYVTRRYPTVWPSVTLLLNYAYTKLVDQLAFLKSHITEMELWCKLLCELVHIRQLERYHVTTKKLVSSWG